MKPEDILRALLAAFAANQPAPASAQPPAAAALPSSPIDNALGGDALKGKKTMLAVLAYMVLSILQTQDVVGLATGPALQQPAASAQATAPTPANGKTPTGVILTTLIGAFGGLGFLAKIDRGVKALGMAAGAETGK